MLRNKLATALFFACTSFVGAAYALPAITANCDVVIAGGSTAALAAALTAAKDGASTCLLEPTDWVGGQLLSVPAIDIAWGDATRPGFPTLGSSVIDRDPNNLPPVFKDWMQGLRQTTTTGLLTCSVSGIDGCYLPVKSTFSAATDKTLLSTYINPAIAAQPRLQVFYGSVVKSVATQATVGGKQKIVSLTAIRRTPKSGSGYDDVNYPLSADIADWYASADSARFNKQLITFSSSRVGGAIFIDATELGDVLAVSKSAYTIGVENIEGDLAGDESCGQAIVYPFFMKYKATSGGVPDNSPLWTAPNPTFYSYKAKPTDAFTWSSIWAYRRVANPLGTTPYPGSTEFQIANLGNSISNQNWGTGNDYPFGYLFKGKSASLNEVNSPAGWQGGINVSVLAGAERHAIGWFKWMRERAPQSSAGRITIGTELTGTATGLAKFPYLRDTRRSMGIENFRLKTTDFVPDVSTPNTGRRFSDRVALANYPVDIHWVNGCAASARTPAIDHPYPSYLPFRALTNISTENLLVAGKTMSTSFLANAATRLQPEEFASGQAAGAAASYMVRAGLSSTSVAYQNIVALQLNTVKYTPNQWTIAGAKF